MQGGLALQARAGTHRGDGQVAAKLGAEAGLQVVAADAAGGAVHLPAAHSRLLRLVLRGGAVRLPPALLHGLRDGSKGQRLWLLRRDDAVSTIQGAVGLRESGVAVLAVEGGGAVRLLLERVGLTEGSSGALAAAQASTRLAPSSVCVDSSESTRSEEARRRGDTPAMGTGAETATAARPHSCAKSARPRAAHASALPRESSSSPTIMKSGSGGAQLSSSRAFMLAGWLGLLLAAVVWLR